MMIIVSLRKTTMCKSKGQMCSNNDEVGQRKGGVHTAGP
jgi:hypothetical protein